MVFGQSPRREIIGSKLWIFMSPVPCCHIAFRTAPGLYLHQHDRPLAPQPLAMFTSALALLDSVVSSPDFIHWTVMKHLTQLNNCLFRYTFFPWFQGFESTTLSGFSSSRTPFLGLLLISLWTLPQHARTQFSGSLYLSCLPDVQIHIF